MPADLLARGFTTYVIDRRGRGASGDSEQHTLRQEADDIAAVLELVGPDSILLGHSCGGLVALAHALRQPVVLENTISLWPAALHGVSSTGWLAWCWVAAARG